MDIVLLILQLILLCANVFILYSLWQWREKSTGTDYDAMSRQLQSIENRLSVLAQQQGDEFRSNRQESLGQSRALREELNQLLLAGNAAQNQQMREVAAQQERMRDTINEQLRAILEASQNQQEKASQQWQTRFLQNQEQLDRMQRMTAEQLQTMQNKNQEQQERVERVIATQLTSIQSSNENKLEQMRLTVDEKLNETLSKRLDTSFKQVGDQLERVYRSMGEMQSLASGVSDLQRVLTNVKARGTWAEVQLGNLLEQVLTKEQYATNVAVKKNSAERVEFAIKLPGKDQDGNQPIWLPIDAKFPQEDYLRILEASEKGDPVALDAAGKQLEARILSCARDIRDKYIAPPHTTDFGIMYLPTEGLYAEVLRRTGICEKLQQEYRVVVAGPMTLAAVVNALAVGFKTLAVEKRSSEVWKLLGAIKTQYGKFSDILDKAQKKIHEAGNTIGEASQKTKYINSRLSKVSEINAEEAGEILGLEEPKAWESASSVIASDAWGSNTVVGE